MNTEGVWDRHADGEDFIAAFSDPEDARHCSCTIEELVGMYAVLSTMKELIVEVGRYRHLHGRLPSETEMEDDPYPDIPNHHVIRKRRLKRKYGRV